MQPTPVPPSPPFTPILLSLQLTPPGTLEGGSQLAMSDDFGKPVSMARPLFSARLTMLYGAQPLQPPWPAPLPPPICSESPSLTQMPRPKLVA